MQTALMRSAGADARDNEELEALIGRIVGGDASPDDESRFDFLSERVSVQMEPAVLARVRAKHLANAIVESERVGFLGQLVAHLVGSLPLAMLFCAAPIVMSGSQVRPERSASPPSRSTPVERQA